MYSTFLFFYVFKMCYLRVLAFYVSCKGALSHVYKGCPREKVTSLNMGISMMDFNQMKSPLIDNSRVLDLSTIPAFTFL